MDDLNLWKVKFIGDACPHPECAGFVETHDPGGDKSHQMCCSINPQKHFCQIGAGRYCTLNSEALRRDKT